MTVLFMSVIDSFKSRIKNIQNPFDVCSLVNDISLAYCKCEITDEENNMLIDMIKKETDA